MKLWYRLDRIVPGVAGLGLVLLILLGSAFAFSHGPGPSHRTTVGLDVVVDDSLGYHHYLVFRRDSDGTFVTHQLDLFINDRASIDPHDYDRIAFSVGEGERVFRAPSFQPGRPDRAAALTFTIDRGLLADLSRAGGGPVRLLGSGRVEEYRFADPAVLGAAEKLLDQD